MSSKVVRHALVFVRAAEFRIALVILRPETMNHETELSIRAALLPAVASGVAGTECWRPGERQDVEIEACFRGFSSVLCAWR